MTNEPRLSAGAAESPDERQRLARLASEWDDRRQPPPGTAIVQSLDRGMTTLRELLFTRVHEDVERNFGADSMLMPVSPEKIEQRTKSEINFYQVAESTNLVRAEKWVSDASWYREWLGRVLLDQQFADRRAVERVSSYLAMSEDDRRLEFARVLQKTIAEAAQAPLVLFRMFPLAIQIATAVAFEKLAKVQSLRDKQLGWLPAILGCHHCHGRPLGNGEVCAECGNPIWKYRWLNEAD